MSNWRNENQQASGCWSRTSSDCRIPAAATRGLLLRDEAPNIEASSTISASVSITIWETYREFSSPTLGTLPHGTRQSSKAGTRICQEKR